MLVTGRGEDGGSQAKSVKEGVGQLGEGSTRRKTGSGKEAQGESKVKAASNQQQMDLKVKGASGGSQQVEGGGSSPAGAGGSGGGGGGGSDQMQENGNRWWLILSSTPFIFYITPTTELWAASIKIEMYIIVLQSAFIGRLKEVKGGAKEKSYDRINL